MSDTEDLSQNDCNSDSETDTTTQKKKTVQQTKRKESSLLVNTISKKPRTDEELKVLKIQRRLRRFLYLTINKRLVKPGKTHQCPACLKLLPMQRKPMLQHLIDCATKEMKQFQCSTELTETQSTTTTNSSIPTQVQ